MRHDGGARSNHRFRECKAVRAVLPLIGAIALAGCVSQQEQQQKNVTAQLDTWIRQSISTVVGAHGPPQATFDLGPNKKMFQWVITSQPPGLVAPISGMVVTRRPQTQECRISLTATTSRGQPRHWRIGLSRRANICTTILRVDSTRRGVELYP